MDQILEKEDFTCRVKELIKQIPIGKVATYGQIAFLAGHPRNTRRVVWILHACSDLDQLPWQRVINQKGTISLPPNAGYEKQKMMLQQEGIIFGEGDRINLDQFLWDPDRFKGF